MNRSTLTLIAGLAFVPLTATAQVRDANSILRGQIQALQAAGFSGMTEVPVPHAPATARTLLVSAQVDETTEALAALGASQINVTLTGETARTLGFDFNGDHLPAKGYVTPTDQPIIRYFSATTFRGKTDIIISEVRKETREFRSYLVSPDGTLEAAAVTRKVNGKFQAERIPVSEAQAGCRNLLEFWTSYYREKLKNV